MGLIRQYVAHLVHGHDTHPDETILLTFGLTAATAVALHIASYITRNYSWVDRAWSIIPVVCAWIFACNAKKAGKGKLLRSSPNLLNKADMFAAIITLWGLRLTYNFYRRGGYSVGRQDYRWNYVRSWPIFARSPAIWAVFHFLVVSLLQTMLLWAIALPMSTIPASPICPKSLLYAGAMLLFLTLETICDEQQWRFQRAKRTNRRGTHNLGFCVTGVFGFSRHLNVFCEGAFWMTLALAAHCLGAQSHWWLFAGAIGLEVLMFIALVTVTEPITRSKYPLYALYQCTTPMLFPATYSQTNRTLHLLERKRRGE